MTFKVHMQPSFSGVDEGDGGVRRVVEGQLKALPRLGIEFVDNVGDARVIACHIEIPPQYLLQFPDKPFVTHCHGLYWEEYDWDPWAYKVNRKVLSAIEVADAVTAPTEWVAEVLRRHTSRAVTVIPHGVNMRDWQPSAKPRDYVLWNKTRIDPVCDPAPLNAVIRACPDLGFVSTFGDEASNLTVTGKLPFEESKQLVRNAGTYLCTSRETFGIATLEAMACGIPVVAFNFGGQAEYVEHGVSGWLAEPGDIDSLAKGLRWAAANRETAGAAAQDVVRRFTWTAAAEQYRDLYKLVADNELRAEKAPRVSIIVPAYNLEKYLPDTLDSVLRQKDESWECIVVDDASPDGCGAIADRYAKKDKRFRVIHNATNRYLSEARNIGIRAAKGRYILPLDADDMLTPHAVGVLADALDRDRHLQVAYGGVLFVNEDGQTPTDYGTQAGPGHSNWPVDWEPTKQASGQNLLPYASMYRKTAWHLTGGYRRRHKTSEDADFWTRFASYGFAMAKVTSADTLVYRNREGSMSRVNQAQRQDYLRWFPWAREMKLAPAGLGGDHLVSLLEPAVSVVIPVGPEHTQLVQDAVDSVAAQSIKNWEIIVVNDSGQELELPAWVRQIPCDARDVSTARNLGIEHAHARLYLPLDADDYLQPHALSWLLQARRESGADVVYPDFFQDFGNGITPDHHALPAFACVELTRHAVHSITALTPVSLWKAVGGYRSGIGWEDWDFQLACGAVGACSVRLAAPLFVYRKHTGKRRDWESGEVFEERKQQILERWEDYFTGRKTFMACGCQGGQITPPTLVTEAQRLSQAQFGEAVLVEYIGGRAGAVQFRGAAAYYSFGASSPKSWVAGEDAHIFTGRRDFTVTAPAVGGATAEGPVLVA